MKKTEEDFHQAQIKDLNILFTNSNSEDNFIDWKGEKFIWEESTEDYILEADNAIFDHNFNSFPKSLAPCRNFSNDPKHDLNHFKDLKEESSHFGNITESNESKKTGKGVNHKIITRIPFHKKEKLLIDRRDIINKTILRTIRKYFRSSFHRDFTQPRYSSVVKRVTSFINSLDQYVNIQCSDQLKHLDSNSEMYLEELSKYTEIIGRLISDNLFSKFIKHDRNMKSNNDIDNFTLKFNDCCLNYSHQKFENLISDINFKKVFEIFMKNKENDFINSIIAIKNNIKSYRNALNQIQLVINGGSNLKNIKDDDSFE